MSGEPEAGRPRRSLPRRLLNRLEVDQAVFFAVSQRVWQFLAGPLTLLLIASFFTPEVQGFYYTFWSVVALQAFFELALPQTLITTASHLWSDCELRDDRSVGGDPRAVSQLAHLTEVSLWMFCASAAVFFVSVGLFGFWFFSREPTAGDIEWRGPWAALIVLSAVSFLTTPLLSVLEGCNRVADVYRLQFARAILGNIAVWVSIPLGFSLWIPAIATLVRLITDLIFLGGRYGPFFLSLFRGRSAARLNWRHQVWPFQYRVIVKGFLVYLNADLMGPVLFHYHGAAWAGQLGMTWQVISALRAACSSWVRARYAQMGLLAARRDFRELDRVFFRVSAVGSVIMVAGAVSFWGAVFALETGGWRHIERLLPAWPTAWLLVGVFAALIVEFLWMYIHSHRVSPYLFQFLFGSLISGALIWWWGAVYGRSGVAAAFCLVQAGIYLPLSFFAWRTLRRTTPESRG